MNPGKLNHRIDVLENQKVTNELKETSYQYVQTMSLYAAIIPQTGIMQRQEAETILTNVTHKIIVRYVAGKKITKDMQIKFRESLFEIKYILNPYFKNETLEIFCTEVMD
ncbi:phage head closure protein [Bacillus infantis]|uniref:phage head closure protein n=1 Tax=Bacillus infantis TaxID=324767 RepID=UPI003CF087A7